MSTRHFRRRFLLVLTGLAVFAALAFLGPRRFLLLQRHSEPSMEDVVTEIRKIGQVKRDESLPGRPIVEAELSGRRVTDFTMELVAKLTELHTLSLEDTRVTDGGLRHVGNLRQLRSLSLDGTLITDEGLSELSRLHKLEWLDLCDTRVTDRGLALLVGLKGLRQLGLNDRTVGDEALASLASLRDRTQLREVFVRETRFTNDGIERFRRANPDVRIVGPRCLVETTPFLPTPAQRRIRRQGWTGRLRLAWRTMVGLN